MKWQLKHTYKSFLIICSFYWISGSSWTFPIWILIFISWMFWVSILAKSLSKVYLIFFIKYYFNSLSLALSCHFELHYVLFLNMNQINCTWISNSKNKSFDSINNNKITRILLSIQGLFFKVYFIFSSIHFRIIINLFYWTKIS